jgi:hypothetical protein
VFAGRLFARRLAQPAEMWDRSMMVSGLRRLWVLVTALWCVLLASAPAYAWVENHVEGLESRIEVAVDGSAVVEHRLELFMNGNVHQKSYRIDGIDPDAKPTDDGYVVPAADALSGKLDHALPLRLTIRKDPESKDVALLVEVDDRKGLWRGHFLFVLRYETSLHATGAIERDGGLTRIVWRGPILDDGYDNARTTFVIPASPSPPRSVAMSSDESAEDDNMPGLFLAEVQRGQDKDEIELLRSYAPSGEAVRWAIRVDPRAVEPPMRDADAAPPMPVFRSLRNDIARPEVWGGIAIGVFLLVLLLATVRVREVKRVAAEVDATVPAAVPLPAPLRVLGAAVAAVGGLALQLRFDRPVLGAIAMVAACMFVAHGVARPNATRRGPGRWLNVTEREALGPVPPPSGAWLDSSTRVGKLLLLLLLVAHGVAVWQMTAHSSLLAIQLGFDAVLWLALFGTGRMVTMPPDLAVEPARFYRVVAKRLRKMKGLERARLVPRIRIPQGGMDADEMRLGVSPKLPLRGFVGIEIGVTYALGFGPRVAMPEVLVRVIAGSPCDDALAAVSKRGRISPGRKPDERVIALAPRFPTARMTAEIAGALATRVMDRDALARTAEQRVAKPKRKRRRRRGASDVAA